jgi:hypothetical protein
VQVEMDFTLLALLPFSVLPAPLPRLSVEPVAAVDFARLSVEAAENLAGRDVLAVVPLDVAPWPHDGWYVYGTFARVGVANAGAEVPERSAWLRRATERQRVTARGRVEVVRHRASVHGGQQFDAFTELRFTER